MMVMGHVPEEDERLEEATAVLASIAVSLKQIGESLEKFLDRADIRMINPEWVPRDALTLKPVPDDYIPDHYCEACEDRIE